MVDDDFIVTPWQVDGVIDYDKLIKRFGTQRIDVAMLKKITEAAGRDHFMLRRGVFFSHRDLDKILDLHKKNKPFFVYTGRGPSSATHIGHLIPWVFAKWLQDRFGVNVYFQLTDDEKFFAKKDLTLDNTLKLAQENALDFIALGFNPKKTKIVIDTRDIHKLYPIAAQIAKRINFSNTKAVFGFGGQTNIGMIFYTAIQSAMCYIQDAPVLIPLGVDQDPHFRLTRDVAPLLKKPKPALVHNIMMPPLQGTGGKMSSSAKNSAIFTTDSPQCVEKKINKYAFSGGQPDIDEHRKLGGNTDIDISYQYLRMFFEPNDVKLEKIRTEYVTGKMLTGELKAILIERINEYLVIHQERREKARDKLEGYFLDT